MNRQPAALITGATGLLGQALTRAFARAGYLPIPHTRAHLSEAAALAEELGGGIALAADLAVPGGAEELFAAALARLPAGARLEVVVNNASDYPEDTLDDLDADTLARLTILHVHAPLALTRALAGHAAGRPDGDGDDGAAADANVVNIIDARVGGRDPRHAAYLLSKETLAVLTRQCARRYAPGLRVNGLAPGKLSRVAASPPATGAGTGGAAAAAPLRRLATPEAAAEAALWLARARNVTGQIVAVDGGRHLLGAALSMDDPRPDGYNPRIGDWR